MNLSNFQHGEMLTLSVTPESGTLPDNFKVGQEVRIVFPQTGSETLIVFDSVNSIIVDPHDDNSRRRLDTLRQTDPARIVWLAGLPQSDQGIMTLQVHRFQSRIYWEEDLVLGVDERIIERVSKIADKNMTLKETCEWLSKKVRLPPTSSEGVDRFIATGGVEDGGRFRILGNWIGIDISPDKESTKVDTVVSLQRRKQGFKPPEFLLEGNLIFEDITIVGKMRQSTRAQLDKIVEEADSYLALWGKYQSMEWQNLVRRARELGWLEYHSFEALPNGMWKFKTTDKDAFFRFQSNLSFSDYEDLEANQDVAPELQDRPSEDGINSRDRNRTAVGRVERLRSDTYEVLLRPMDEDNDVIPPKKGFLFASMHGDRTRLKRREQAIVRIKSADARLPQLGLILEGYPAQIRRSDKIDRLFSKATRELFHDEPTTAQKKAIDIALNTPDIAVIQGPPGTGKTKVIAAILARLAELETEKPELAGRTLLTSYQHDAVDHAASKSRVFGLPPVRHGGRRDGAQTSDDELQRWAALAKERVDAALAGLPEERPLAIYRNARDQVAAYAAGCLPDEQVVAVVDNLIALPTGVLPTEVWEQLNSVKRNLTSPPNVDAGGFDHELKIKTIRGLRVTAESFADDGPRKSRQVLKQFEIILSPEDKVLLESAVETVPGEVFQQLDQLSNLRDRLLDQHSSTTVPDEKNRRDPEVMDVLNRSVNILYQQMKASKGGVADALEEYADALLLDPEGVLKTLEQYSSVYAATCQQAVGYQMVSSKGGENTDLSFENVVVDEAARANPLDLFIPISLATRRILLVGDHRQLPHMLEPDVERELSENANELTKKALKVSLFQRLFDDLNARELKDGFPRVVTLDQQFRMHPLLGDFVSRVFYEPNEAFESPRKAIEFEHKIGGYLKSGLPVCAAWKDLPFREKGEVKGKSKSRPTEAKWIAKEVRRLLEEDGSEVNIGVISFYRAQVDAINEALVTEGIAEKDQDTGIINILTRWRTLERADGSREELLRIGTVDAFQGKEFDVVFLSVTRSNILSGSTDEEMRRKYGHLMLPNRLCVAMSRQRRLLVAVGDKEMFATAEAITAVPGLSHFLTICGGEDGLVC